MNADEQRKEWAEKKKQEQEAKRRTQPWQKKEQDKPSMDEMGLTDSQQDYYSNS
jgi:hypothetical protein